MSVRLNQREDLYLYFTKLVLSIFPLSVDVCVCQTLTDLSHATHGNVNWITAIFFSNIEVERLITAFLCLNHHLHENAALTKHDTR